MERIYLFFLKLHLKSEFAQAIFIFLFIFGIFFLSWNGSVAGYEPDTIDAATALTNGHYLLKKPAIGSSLLYVPFVLINNFFSSTPNFKLLTLVPMFYSALTMVIIFIIANRLNFPRSISILGTILIALGSLVWPYSKIGMEYQEMFFIGLILLSLIQWRHNRTISIMITGLSLALLTLAKSYGIVFCLPALLFIFEIYKQDGKIKEFFNFSNLTKLLLPTLLTVSYILTVNVLFQGRLSGAYKLSDEFQIVSWWDGIWGIFFGFGKSILIYSPLLIPAIFYLPEFYKKFKAEATFIISGFILYFIITAPFSYWSDETLSVRKLIPLIPFLHFPIFIVLTKLESVKNKLVLIIAGLFVLLSVYVQLINSLYPYFRYMIIVRSANADSLEQMRYNPEVSQIHINHILFTSYLKNMIFKKSGTYQYTENTWMRHFQNEGVKDFTLIDLNLDLSKWNTPSTNIVIGENKLFKKTFLLFDLLLVTTTGFCLISTIKNKRKI